MIRIITNTDGGVKEQILIKDKIQSFLFQKDLVGTVQTFQFTMDTGEVISGRASTMPELDKVLKEFGVVSRKKAETK